MFNYIVRRLVYGVITLLALSIIVFWLLQNTGGGPLDRLKANPRITRETVQSITEFYGLDQPPLQQYFTWLSKYVTGDWGLSFQAPTPVRELVIQRLGGTLRLMMTSLTLAVLIGIPLGINVYSCMGAKHDILSEAKITVAVGHVFAVSSSTNNREHTGHYLLGSRHSIPKGT